MKIGILTQPLNLNYGGLLQNYALQTVLKREGHDVYTLDWVRSNRNLIWYFKIIGLYFAHYILPSKYEKPQIYIPNEDENNTITHNIHDFITNYIKATPKIRTSKGFKQYASSLELEALIVGSDQCWRPMYNKAFLPEMFLSFVKDNKDIKKVAYAVSFGTELWEYNDDLTKYCSLLAQKFDIVTVRENSGINLCRKYLDISAEQVLDPTMLLGKEDYIKLIENNKEPLSEGTLHYYFLDPSIEKNNIVNSIADSFGLIPFSVIPKYNSDYRTKENIKNDIENCVYPSVTKWLRAFMDSKLVIVDSFHGMVFSIIFHKPFWVIKNNRRGNARFESMLRLFHLEDRLVTTDEFDVINKNKEIDWIHVDEVMKSWQLKSRNLLFQCLS